MLIRNSITENWRSVYKAVNVKEAYDNFVDVCTKHCDTSCPTVKMALKNKILRDFKLSTVMLLLAT